MLNCVKLNLAGDFVVDILVLYDISCLSTTKQLRLSPVSEDT